MVKTRKAKTFTHPKTGHQVRTSLPVEQNRLRGQGYREQKPRVTAPARTPAPAVKPTGNKK